MDRRDFVRSASMTALAAGFCIDPFETLAAAQSKPAAATGPAAVPPAYPPPFDSPPVLQNPAADGVTILIAVNAISTAWVEYGPTQALGQVAHSAVHGLRSLSGQVHRIRLEGLAPNTRCFYRVVVCPIDFKGAYKIRRGQPVAAEVRSFTTLDDGRGSRCSFNVINDTHENMQTLAGVCGLVAKHQADMTFWNGDIFNDVRSDPQIVANIMRPTGAIDGVGYAAQSPLFFVSGNHDVRGIHARSLDRYLDLPGGKRHYVLRQGPVALLVLDTGEDKADDNPAYAGLCEFSAYREVQRRWLETAVKDPKFRNAPFRIVVQHIPMFGKAASADSHAKWQPILASAKINLMICGHVHEFAYHEPNAEHDYAQLVGGGPAPESATFIHAEADRRKLTVTVRDVEGRQKSEHTFRA